ncbi:hypothetical protein BpHYR1_032115 [Brachionus plicatilis]|uniref:Uncharacterized protein n=1 Tax=Brachionus plicatilis TaxID=10195 RepID=A0A3M7RCG4_BRAPC|nr:hypothetical protein BpHYR1_032115 [Brachionus plicatilis]
MVFSAAGKHQIVEKLFINLGKYYPNSLEFFFIIIINKIVIIRPYLALRHYSATCVSIIQQD